MACRNFPGISTIFFLLIVLSCFVNEFFALITTPVAKPPSHCLYSSSSSSSSSEKEEADVQSPIENDLQITQIETTTEEPPPAAPAQQQLSANDMMRAMGTSPRRIFLSVLSASGIALAGNFLGVTSKLLTAVPEEAVEATQLDTYFPRGKF